MFRDEEIRYVIASVSVAWLITILLAAYEIFINRSDTGLETGVASAVGMAIATGITLLLVGTWEVFMVLVRRVNERLLAEARREGQERGKEQGLEQGLKQGLGQGLEQGLEQGLKQGLEQGLEHGLKQGEKQGLERGQEAERQRWQDWYDSLPEEFKDQRPPPPTSPQDEEL